MHNPRDGHLLRGVAWLTVAASLVLASRSPARAGVGAWTIEEGLGSRTITALAIDSAMPVILYAGTSSGGVFKTTDGGALGGGQYGPYGPRRQHPRDRSHRTDHRLCGD